MMQRVKVWFLLVLFLFSFTTLAANLSDIQVSNGRQEAKITLSFSGQPVYAFFPLHNPERVVLDIRQSAIVGGLPLTFSGDNIVKRIRSSEAKDSQSIRLVFELTEPGKTRATTQRSGNNYNVVFTISGTRPAQVASRPAPAPVASANTSRPAPVSSSGNSSRPASTQPTKNPFNANPVTAVSSGTQTARPRSTSSSRNDTIIVAIDAGHGGQDPGAIGGGGLKEKNVTIAIARKLKALLNADPMFKGVMTRDGDYFISVMGRSDVARKQNANLLVSIHADAAPNRSASGASVWVLSNRRANSEMAGWLEQHEKQSELLGGAGDLLANSQADKYLSQAVLDLQFGHSQRVGYDVAVKVIAQLQRVGALHKRRPEHASLGVLRSPDIPSLLVETGFISNPSEERLLGSSDYQQKIAESIYKGLRNYFLAHPLQSVPKEENRPLRSAAAVKPAVESAASSSGTVQRHVVQRGETLSGIAAKYGVSMTTLRSMNTLKKDVVWVGQRLKVPAEGVKQTASAAKAHRPIRHKVVRGDSLTAIAVKYGVSPQAIQQANKMKTQNVMLGQTLTIPVT